MIGRPAVVDCFIHEILNWWITELRVKIHLRVTLLTISPNERILNIFQNFSNVWSIIVPFGEQ